MPSKAIMYTPQRVFNKFFPFIIWGGGGPIIAYGYGGGAFS